MTVNQFVFTLLPPNAAAEQNGRFTVTSQMTPSSTPTPHWELSRHETDQLLFVGCGVIWNWEADSATFQTTPQTFFQRFAAAYQEKGLAFLCQLTGQFAFALYDKQRQQLYAFRDPLGYYSLYCMEQDGALYVASQVQALAAVKKERQLSLLALKLFFKFGYLLAPHTPIEGIVKLLPGEYVVGGENGRFSHHRYWTPPPVTPEHKGDSYFVEASRQELWAALRRSLNGVEKAALFLSGGIDSAILAGMLAQLPDVETTAYTIGLNIPHHKVDYTWDMPYARQVAARHHLPYQELLLDGNFPIATALLEAMPYYDIPQVSPNIVTKRQLAKLVRAAGISTIITGSAAMMPYQAFSAGGFEGHNVDLSQRAASILYKVRAGFLDDTLLAALFPETQTISQEQLVQVLDPYFEGIPFESGNFDNYQSGRVLTYVTEKMISLHHYVAQAEGLQMRMPYYDQGIWAFRARTPRPLRGSEGTYPPRFLLVEPFRHLLPDAVITREKVGYPSYYWYRGELDSLQQQLFADGVRQHFPYLDIDVARRTFQEELGSNRKSSGKVTWGMTVFLLWYLQCMVGWDVAGMLPG